MWIVSQAREKAFTLLLEVLPRIQCYKNIGATVRYIILSTRNYFLAQVLTGGVDGGHMQAPKVPR